MAKYIDADEAILEIEKHLRIGDEIYQLSDKDRYTNDGLIVAADVVYHQPAADVEPVRKWIPVTERLPEEDGRYLITGKRGTVYSLEYEDERWYGGIQPIAWMPLPEPYKEGEQND